MKGSGAHVKFLDTSNCTMDNSRPTDEVSEKVRKETMDRFRTKDKVALKVPKEEIGAELQHGRLIHTGHTSRHAPENPAIAKDQRYKDSRRKDKNPHVKEENCSPPPGFGTRKEERTSAMDALDTSWDRLHETLKKHIDVSDSSWNYFHERSDVQKDDKLRREFQPRSPRSSRRESPRDSPKSSRRESPRRTPKSSRRESSWRSPKSRSNRSQLSLSPSDYRRYVSRVSTSANRRGNYSSMAVSLEHSRHPHRVSEPPANGASADRRRYIDRVSRGHSRGYTHRVPPSDPEMSKSPQGDTGGHDFREMKSMSRDGSSQTEQPDVSVEPFVASSESDGWVQIRGRRRKISTFPLIVNDKGEPQDRCETVVTKKLEMIVENSIGIAESWYFVSQTRKTRISEDLRLMFLEGRKIDPAWIQKRARKIHELARAKAPKKDLVNEKHK